MTQLYKEDYNFKAFFYNTTGKEIETATADEIIVASQKLLINFTITENARETLEHQIKIKDCRIKELELELIQQNFTPFRSGSPDPKPKNHPFATLFNPALEAPARVAWETLADDASAAELAALWPTEGVHATEE